MSKLTNERKMKMTNDFSASEARNITKNYFISIKENLKQELDKVIDDIKFRAARGDTESITNVCRILAEDVAKNLSDMGFDVRIDFMNAKVGPLSEIHRLHISWDKEKGK